MSFESPARIDLSDIGVLVTRAAHQAGSLSGQIAAKGGRPIRFPAVVIKGPVDLEQARQQMVSAQDCDILIFISQNAVMYGAKLSPEERLSSVPALVAVGRGTAQKLAEMGYPVDVVPVKRFDSEALLDTPELNDVDGKRVVIVRGNGGRSLLGDELVKRGAKVEYAEVYTRSCPEVDPSGVLQQCAR